MAQLKYINDKGDYVERDSPDARVQINPDTKDAQETVDRLKKDAGGPPTSALNSALVITPESRNASPYDGIDKGVLDALMKAGYDTTDKLMGASDDDLLKVVGVSKAVLLKLRDRTTPVPAFGSSPLPT